MLEVPKHIPRPPYADRGSLPDWDPNPQVHGPEGIERMRAAGKLAARVLEYAGTLVKVGDNWFPSHVVVGVAKGLLRVDAWHGAPTPQSEYCQGTPLKIA